MTKTITIETLKKRRALIERLDQVIAMGQKLNKILDENTCILAIKYSSQERKAA